MIGCFILTHILLSFDDMVRHMFLSVVMHRHVWRILWGPWGPCIGLGGGLITSERCIMVVSKQLGNLVDAFFWA